jgi:hypothetical protein
MAATSEIPDHQPEKPCQNAFCQLGASFWLAPAPSVVVARGVTSMSDLAAMSEDQE